ncbi:hypothetical protein D3C87_1231270 [compost metagenome]
MMRALGRKPEIMLAVLPEVVKQMIAVAFSFSALNEALAAMAAGALKNSFSKEIL